MIASTSQSKYHEWSRYEWASEDVPANEHDTPRWNLAEWVGESADGRRLAPVEPASMPEGDAGPSGHHHNPGGGSRWAEGYRH
jgi:hypothetical protein